jgi:hypothetical protein
VDDDLSEYLCWSGWGHRRFGARIGARVLASLAALFVWAGFLILYAAFWSHGFTLIQDLAVFFVSVLALFGVIAGTWVSVGLR